MAVLVPKTETKWHRKRKALRDHLWSDAESVIFLAPRDGGYCRVVPRIVPLTCVLLDLAKQRAGELTASYLDLWVRSDNDGFVEVEDELECAAGAGFLGGRALWSWRERTRELERLGAIRVKGEGHRQIAYILLLHPEQVVEQILKKHGKKVSKVWHDYYERRRRDIGTLVIGKK